MTTYSRDALIKMNRDGLRAFATEQGFVTATSITKAQLLDMLAPQDVEVAGNGDAAPDEAPASPDVLGRSATSTPPPYAVLPPPATVTYPTVVQALGEVMRKVEPIAKDLRNVDSHYAARSIDDVMDTLHDIMAEQGILPVPTVESAEYRDRGKQHEAILRVRWTFHGPAGDTISGVVMGEALDSSDKATNKALQASLKYLLLDVFLVPLKGQDDDDADAKSPEHEPEDTPNSLAQAAGWEDAAAEGDAHIALTRRIKQLLPDDIARARDQRDKLGWPIRSRQAFDGFARWVSAAEQRRDADRREPSADPEQLAAARAALAAAEATVTGKMTEQGRIGEKQSPSGLLNDVPEAVCPTCGNGAGTVNEIVHEEGCPQAEAF